MCCLFWAQRASRHPAIPTVASMPKLCQTQDNAVITSRGKQTRRHRSKAFSRNASHVKAFFTAQSEGVSCNGGESSNGEMSPCELRTRRSSHVPTLLRCRAVCFSYYACVCVCQGWNESTLENSLHVQYAYIHTHTHTKEAIPLSFPPPAPLHCVHAASPSCGAQHGGGGVHCGDLSVAA